MFNFFKRKAVQEPTVGDLLVSAVNEYDLYRLNAIYKKQIHQTGKAAGRHKRRAANYRWQLEHQKGAMKLLGDILTLLHERDPEYGWRGVANNLSPADAVLAALARAFDGSTPDGRVNVTASNVQAARTPFDAMVAAMAAGAVVIGEIDDVLGPLPPDYSKSEPEWAGSGGSSGGAGASGSWEEPAVMPGSWNPAGDAYDSGPAQHDFSDVQSSVSSTESTDSSND